MTKADSFFNCLVLYQESISLSKGHFYCFLQRFYIFCRITHNFSNVFFCYYSLLFFSVILYIFLLYLRKKIFLLLDDIPPPFFFLKGNLISDILRNVILSANLTKIFCYFHSIKRQKVGQGRAIAFSWTLKYI